MHGAFATLFEELKRDDDKFCSYFRMSKRTFEELLSRLHDQLLRENTTLGDAVWPAQELAVAVR